ncbi:MAG: hypothetical protein CHACPFDD_03064 [Phycisphaerae bacterium]|nr:hypothetical protein [Phycisphaerae bacterium]
MIVDCHTQIWDSSAQVRHLNLGSSNELRADAAWHLAASEPVDRSIVLGFKSRYLEAEISNTFVADYVRRHSTKLVGFAGIDPTDPNCLTELAQAQEVLKLKGITLSPGLQDFHPCDTRAMRVYDECAQRRMPVLFQQNNRNPASRLEYARPIHLDEVATDFPDLRIVIAHAGYPWIDETIVMLGKHRYVYAEISGLLSQPWIAYNALLSAYQYGVIDRLLFGSDFPFRSPASCIETLYSINQISHGTNLPAIPRENLRGIVERDALALLGIAERRPAPAASTVVEDE